MAGPRRWGDHRMGWGASQQGRAGSRRGGSESLRGNPIGNGWPMSAPAGDPIDGSGASDGSVGSALDHPIFTESIRLIHGWLGDTGLEAHEQDVLERLVHSGGDLSLAADFRFSPGACAAGIAALRAGAPILTDTAMAAAAVAPMARRTYANAVHTLLEWAPAVAPPADTRTAAALAGALQAHPGALVLIGSAPTALERLLDLVAAGTVAPPPLVIGMPVGFVGVAASKQRLAASGLPQIRLEGSRGGAGLVGAAVNALLRRGWLEDIENR